MLRFHGSDSLTYVYTITELISLPSQSELCAKVSFFAYLTDLDTVSLETWVEVEASGHDMTDLLYHLLDEREPEHSLQVSKVKL